MIADKLRWILMFLCVVQMGWALVILQEAKRFRSPPRHVISAALAYILSMAYIMIETHSNLGREFSWRIPVGFVILGFGLYAMLEMWRYYRYDERIKRHKQKAEEAARKLVEESARIVKAEKLDKGEEV